MVARINTGKSISKALNYNEQKVRQGTAEILAAIGFVKDGDQMNFYDKISHFERQISLNQRNNIYNHQTEFKMEKNSFTLIDAFNQFWTVCGGDDGRALSCAGLTYFYLCSVWNSTGRSISFRRQNALVCAELFISRPTLEKHRNVLKQYGLIDFFSKGKGDPNITYKILQGEGKPKEVKKGNTFINPDTLDDLVKAGGIRENELHVVIAGEINKYDCLEQLFEKDAGLQKNFRQKGLPSGKFRNAVEQWMIQNNGCQYEHFRDARKHFLFWMPNYQWLNKSYHEITQPGYNRKNPAKRRPTDSDYAGGL